ncbi:nucleoside triphosphate pyrophosphohydrolase ham1 [Ascosphaera pollenicola]|nr:nucleoside triphosphate pyrophosphohydrolase ham1 [Ascosphaera pollenicola]
MSSSYFSSPATRRHDASSPDITEGAATALLSPNEAPRSSALSNRLNSVLSTLYLDSDIRGTLDIIDGRNVQNTAETRRQLRQTAQKEVIVHNGVIINDFGLVADQLKRIGAVIGRLNNVCDGMRRDIAMARRETQPVLEEASALNNARRELEIKDALLKAFSKRFILTDDEVLAMTSPVEPVDNRFFAAVLRAKRIHQDCEVLLGAANQQLGLDIMEKTSKSLDSAYKKLYKWTQSEFKRLSLEDPQLGSQVRQALKVLAERPLLFNSCFDTFAASREHTLSESFHLALDDAFNTGKASRAAGSQPKPIEFSAHDPLRYIGDILAWVHSAAVSEREALSLLFVSDDGELVKGIQAGISHEPWMQLEDEPFKEFDWKKALDDLVDRDLSGVTRSLYQRVELVLRGQEACTILYEVLNLLDFYEHTFVKLVGRDSSLVKVMIELTTHCSEQFNTLINDNVTSLSNDTAALEVPDDLSIPEYLSEALNVLSSLMKTYNSSYGKEPSHPQGVENKFTPVIRRALDPYVNLIQRSEDLLSQKEDEAKKRRLVFRANCVLAIIATISLYPFASATHLSQFSTMLEDIRVQLLEVQRHFFLKESGLQMLLQDLTKFSNDAEDHDLTTIPNLPAFQPNVLVSVSQQLDSFLPSALVDATDNLKHIGKPSLIKSVTEEAVELFVRDFEFIEDSIVRADDACGISNVDFEAEVEEEHNFGLRALFPRTTGEIRVLLS